MKIEAVFGGFLVLIVLAVALYALLSTDFGKTGAATATSKTAGEAKSALPMLSRRVLARRQQCRRDVLAIPDRVRGLSGPVWRGWGRRLDRRLERAPFRQAL